MQKLVLLFNWNVYEMTRIWLSTTAYTSNFVHKLPLVTHMNYHCIVTYNILKLRYSYTQTFMS